MASFTLPVSFPVGNVFLAAKDGQEKGFWDWILDGMQKEQLVETDPVLKKVEGKNDNAPPGRAALRKKGASPPSQKKSGGFGGLFTRK